MKRIRIKLLSDGTFGRGDGVPGIVDDEIDYDIATGLPFLKGRTLKGLIVEECSNILFSVSRFAPGSLSALEASAGRLFGAPGSTEHDEGSLHFGEALVDEAIRIAIRHAVTGARRIVQPVEILNAFTGVRRRSAIDEVSDAPKDETLRSARIVMRGIELFAPIIEIRAVEDLDWQLLAASIAGLRRGGKNRNRGAGKLECALLDDTTDQTATWSSDFLKRHVKQAVSL